MMGDGAETATGGLGGNLLQFSPFSSFVEPGFWWKLTENKVNVYKLDDTPKPIRAYYSNANSAGLPSRLTVDFSALDPSSTPSANSFVSHGILYLSNTIETFRTYPKKDLLRNIGISIWSDIRSGRVFHDPSLLSRFILLCFIDAKKYYYHYWFGYPALCFPDEIRLSPSNRKIQKLSDAYSTEEIEVLQRVCSTFTREDATGYFLLEECEKALFQPQPLSNIKDTKYDANKLILVFCDPSTHEAAPGWPARNLLALWAYHRPETMQVRLLCWRQRFHKGKVECGHSLLLVVSYSQSKEQRVTEENGDGVLKVVGWEKNENGQLAHRMVDLSSTMQPAKLADNAVNLNLQLMRWRLVPELNLDLLYNTSCLIFGAGTLGCNVARCCMGWGIRKITFVDCAKVSYSNPLRQSLYTFEDCVDGGKWKADAAAENLKKILPNAEAKGVRLTVPMPGHVVAVQEMRDVMKTVNEIEELVKSHDIIFLVMDTREGRWLPTLLATLHAKLTFSVALGFDSFVVVRHGLGCDPVDKQDTSLSKQCITGDRLGCYFCTDVVAPSDSSVDRTLDQQCTVTRPGLSMIASALAVELAVSVLQHPSKGLCSAPMVSNSSTDQSKSDTSHSTTSCLGTLVHQIRGYASTYEQMTATVQRFASCTACSNWVVNEYRKRGFEFLRSVFNNPVELEKVTGLEALKRNTDTAEVLFLSDCESD